MSLKVSVIGTGGTAAALLARQMNVSIPVVIGAMTDPVGSGVVMSLAKPGGNITGLSLATGDDFGIKYLELLSELRPGLKANCSTSGISRRRRFVSEQYWG